MISAKLEGFEDIEQTLKELPLKIRRSVVMGAIRKTANVILDEVKRNSPHDTGAMMATFKIKFHAAKTDHMIFYNIVSPYNYIAIFNEYGTYSKRVEPLSPKTKYTKERAIKRDKIMASGGGMKPTLFLRTSLDTKENEAFDEAKKYVIKRLEKALT